MAFVLSSLWFLNNAIDVDVWALTQLPFFTHDRRERAASNMQHSPHVRHSSAISIAYSKAGACRNLIYMANDAALSSRFPAFMSRDVRLLAIPSQDLYAATALCFGPRIQLVRWRVKSVAAAPVRPHICMREWGQSKNAKGFLSLNQISTVKRY